jgi:hypothetical protein
MTRDPMTVPMIFLRIGGMNRLWVPKSSSADRIDAKRACERRLAERRRTRPGREF